MRMWVDRNTYCLTLGFVVDVDWYHKPYVDIVFLLGFWTIHVQFGGKSYKAF